MTIFAHEEKLFCMKIIANILAFVSTYTVIAMVFLIIAQSLIKCIHNANTLTAMQERITVIVCLLAAAALIPFFHYPYYHSLLEVRRSIYLQTVHSVLYGLSHITVRPSVKIFADILKDAVC